MPRRTVWLATGLVAGAASSLYAERKLRRTVEATAARLQPDALAAEVGRTARQAVASTGGRVRDAVASGRAEKRRRESELWSELDGRAEVAVPGVASGHGQPGQASGHGQPGIASGHEGEASVRGGAGPTHLRIRRVRRTTRRSPSHLGK